MEDNSSDAVASPLVAGRADPLELPDDLRVPLHELQADTRYLVSRVMADGSLGGMVIDAIETKLSHVAEAAYRLNGSRADLLAALEECLEYFEDRSDVVDGDYGVPAANREMQMATMVKEAMEKAEA